MGDPWRPGLVALAAALLLMGFGHRFGLHGLICFFVEDFDALNIPIPGLRSIGLFDDRRGSLTAHPGVATWDAYFSPCSPRGNE